MSEQQSLRSFFATLDVANTHRSIQSCFKQAAALSRLLIDIFHEASPASAESAVLFLQGHISTVEDAERVANIIKSFAGAVQPANIPALADLCAFLVVSFDSTVCAAPLECFAFTGSSAKRIALSAIHSVLQPRQLQRRPVQVPSKEILRRIFPFLEQLVSDPDSSIQRDAVHAITSFPSYISTTDVSTFLNLLPLPPSPFSSSYEPADAHDVNQPGNGFEKFLTLNIARASLSSRSIMSTTAPAFSDVIMRSLARAIDFTDPDTLYELEATNDMSEILFDPFLFGTVTLAVTLACQGRLSRCVRALTVASAVTDGARFRHSSLHPVTIATVEIALTCIKSLASVAACDEAVDLTSKLFQTMRVMQKTETQETEYVLKRVDANIEIANLIDCPASLGIYMLLKGLITRWESPSALVQWLSEDVQHMIQSPAFVNRDGDNRKPVHENAKGGQSALKKAEPQSFVEALRRQGEDYYEGEDDLSSVINPPSIDRTTIRLCTAISVLVSLYHGDTRVRLTAANVYASIPDGAVLLFCLPAAMVRLREERHPAVAIRMLQDAIASKGITCHRETAAIALRALLRVMKSVEMPSQNTNWENMYDINDRKIRQTTSVMQTILVAIAKAANHAPGRVTKILAVEIDALCTRFEHLHPAERVAGAAAINTLVQQRPARGTKFVPFITCCLDRQSTTIAPRATGICLDAMYTMCDEDVMDSTKTVKIVMKKLNPLSSLEQSIRKSFLRLLGRAAQGGTSSKKGRSVTESVIQVLRKCITKWIPNSTEGSESHTLQTITQAGSGAAKTAEEDIQLRWVEVAQAAESLAGFTVNDILRIEFSHEEPLIDLEAERKRLENIEEACGRFVEQLLGSLQSALISEASEAKNSLQLLLKKIAKHEWDERPRGNFDPERIAHLRATSDALKRSRRRAQALKNPSSNKAASADENDTLQQQFAHAVQGMPVGVIRTLCTHSACLDPFAIRACAEAGAVTTALKWPELIDQWLSGTLAKQGDSKAPVHSDMQIDEKWGAGLCVLRVGQASDEAELRRMRECWFAPEDFGSCGHLQATQLFLGCLSFFEDRLLQLTQFLREPSVLMTIIKVMSNMQLDDGKRQKAMLALMATMEEIDALGTCLDEAEQALAELMPNHVMKMIWLSPLSKVRVRLACRVGEGGAVRAIAAEVVQNLHLSADRTLLAVVGRAVAQLREDARRGLICQFAERPSKQAAVICCYGVGAAHWLPKLDDALLAGVGMCELGERLAIGKLAQFAKEQKLGGD